jgi:hypothetical protein
VRVVISAIDPVTELQHSRETPLMAAVRVSEELSQLDNLLLQAFKENGPLKNFYIDGLPYGKLLKAIAGRLQALKSHHAEEVACLRMHFEKEKRSLISLLKRETQSDQRDEGYSEIEIKWDNKDAEGMQCSEQIKLLVEQEMADKSDVDILTPGELARSFALAEEIRKSERGPREYEHLTQDQQPNDSYQDPLSQKGVLQSEPTPCSIQQPHTRSVCRERKGFSSKFPEKSAHQNPKPSELHPAHQAAFREDKDNALSPESFFTCQTSQSMKEIPEDLSLDGARCLAKSTFTEPLSLRNESSTAKNIRAEVDEMKEAAGKEVRRCACVHASFMKQLGNFSEQGER